MPFLEQFVRRPQGLWLRRAIFQVHLWVGIAVGLYVVAISVSGSALFFRNLVNQAAPGRKVVAGSGPLLSNSELIQAATRAYPGFVVSSVYQGKNPGQEVEISLDRGGKRKTRIFDPYTGRDLGEAVPLMLQAESWLLDLHVNLLSGPTGRLVNGIAAIFLTLLGITGAVIWWPGAKNWRRSLTINFKSNWKRINWDLHSAVGFWAFAFFFMWSLTGVYLVFPMPFDALINRFAPLDYYRLVSAPPPPTPAMVNFVRVADEIPAPRPRRRRVIHYSFGDQVIRTLFGAHFGNFAGLKTRIFWAILGLTPPFLFLTGALMWWNRVLSPRTSQIRADLRLPFPSLRAARRAIPTRSESAD
jgi:uncharacterized iron-regulated membrane protein